MKITGFQKSLLLCMTLCISSYSYSKAVEFKPGFIVTLEGDTTKGFILFKSGESRFDYCTFKTAETAEFVEYRPTQILGYGIQGEEYYESKKIRINEIERTYFVETLVRGRASLLEVKGQFFLEDFEKVIYPLEKKITQNNKNEVTTHDSYKGILNWKFLDCKGISSKINKVSLSAEDLSSICKYYNTCVQGEQLPQPLPKKITHEASVYIGASIGYSFTTLSDLEESGFFLLYNNVIDKKEFQKAGSLSAGISTMFSLPRISDHTFINLDILYQKISNDSERTNSTGTRTDKVSVQYSSIQVPLSFVYGFQTNSKFTPNVEIGINPAFVFNESSSWTVDGSGITNIVPIKKVCFGGFAGLGATTDINPKAKLFLKLRFQYGTSPIDDGSPAIHQIGTIVSSGILFKL